MPGEARTISRHVSESSDPVTRVYEVAKHPGPPGLGLAAGAVHLGFSFRAEPEFLGALGRVSNFAPRQKTLKRTP